MFKMLSHKLVMIKEEYLKNKEIQKSKEPLLLQKLKELEEKKKQQPQDL